MSTTAPTPSTDHELQIAAWPQVERAVLDLLRTVNGDNAVDDDAIGGPQPTDWVEGIVATRHIAATAQTILTGYVRAARSAGVPWSALTGPLGVNPADGTDAGIAAFEKVAGDRTPFASHAEIWRCPSYPQIIIDLGPSDPDPRRNQRGHTEDCQRLAAEIAAFVGAPKSAAPTAADRLLTPPAQVEPAAE